MLLPIACTESRRARSLLVTRSLQLGRFAAVGALKTNKQTNQSNSPQISQSLVGGFPEAEAEPSPQQRGAGVAAQTLCLSELAFNQHRLPSPGRGGDKGRPCPAVPCRALPCPASPRGHATVLGTPRFAGGGRKVRRRWEEPPVPGQRRRGPSAAGALWEAAAGVSRPRRAGRGFPGPWLGPSEASAGRGLRVWPVPESRGWPGVTGAAAGAGGGARAGAAGSAALP